MVVIIVMMIVTMVKMYHLEKEEIIYTAVVFLLIKVNYIQKYTLLERYSNHNLLICADIYIIINNNHYIHKQIS
jgi:hypothetical protein